MIVSLERKRKMFLKIITFFCCTFTGLTAVYGDDLEVIYNKDTADKQDDSYIEINITADRTPQKKNEIPLPVSTINKEKLEKNMYTSMVDVLDNSISFSSRYEYHSTIYMRGFSGNNILFLQDGARRTSTTPQGTRANRLNPFMIDRIELIRGPGSVVYGSGALTGIVNVVTTDIFKTRGLVVKSMNSYASNNNEKNIFSMVNYNTGTMALNISGRYRIADDYTLPDGSTAEHSYIKDRDCMIKLGVKPGDNHTIMLTADMHLGGPWSKAAGFNGKPNLEVYCGKEDSYHFALQYTGKSVSVFDQINVLAYYDYEETKKGKRWTSSIGKITSDSLTSMTDHYGGGNVQMQKKLKNHTISLGTDIYIYRVWIDVRDYDAISSPDPVYSRYESIQGGGTNNTGMFLQDKITLGNMTLVAGTRFDYAYVTEGDHHAESLDSVSGYESHKKKYALSGTCGFVYTIMDKMFWNFNIGRAFRMPTYSELYCETVTGKGVVRGNPGLQPEYSFNVDTGLKGAVSIINFECNMFLNFYSNLISQELVDPSNSDAGYVYENVDCARIYGTEIEIFSKIERIFFRKDFIKPAVAFTWYRGDDLEGKNIYDISGETPLLYVPNPELTGSLDYLFVRNSYKLFLGAGLTQGLRQSRVPDGVEPYDPYYYVDVRTGVDFYHLGQLENFKFYITIKNVTNNEYRLFGDYLPAKGRDVRLLVGAQF